MTRGDKGITYFAGGRRTPVQEPRLRMNILEGQTTGAVPVDYQNVLSSGG